MKLYNQNKNKTHRLQVLVNKNKTLKKKVKEMIEIKRNYQGMIQTNWSLTNKVYQLQKAVGKPRYHMEQAMRGAEQSRLKLENVIFFD